MPMSNTRTLDLGDVKAIPDAYGILRWDTYDHAIPMDCLDQFAPKGYDRVKHKAAIDKDTADFFAAYRAKPRVRSPEELSEIMNNIGPDAIDIITGERIFG